MVGCLGIRALPEPGGKRVGIWMCSPLSAGTELQKDLGQIHEVWNHIPGGWQWAVRRSTAGQMKLGLSAEPEEALLSVRDGSVYV